MFDFVFFQFGLPRRESPSLVLSFPNTVRRRRLLLRRSRLTEEQNPLIKVPWSGNSGFERVHASLGGKGGEPHVMARGKHAVQSQDEVPSAWRNSGKPLGEIKRLPGQSTLPSHRGASPSVIAPNYGQCVERQSNFLFQCLTIFGASGSDDLA